MILIKDGRTLRKCYLFSCRYKNVWDIDICLKPHFHRKCQKFRNPKTDFSLTSANKPQSSLVLYLQFEVNRDRRTRRTNSTESFSCKILSNQKHTANKVRNTRRTTLYWMRGMIKELIFIKLTLYLSLSFRNLS